MIIYNIIFILKKYKLIYLTRYLKRFNIKTIIDLREIATKFKINIQILRLYINGKLY